MAKRSATQTITIALTAAHAEAGDLIQIGTSWRPLAGDAERVGLHLVILRPAGHPEVRIEDRLLVVRRPLAQV